MINFSKSAIKELQRWQRAREEEFSEVRLAVESGGCLDLHYDFAFTSEGAADDELSYPVADSLMILIKVKDAPYLENLKIDFSEDLMGGAFRFINPNVAETCGCSQSFTLPAQ
ncbi:MAG: iron-sulfur cluster assembly accessory protein [Synechococcaceae cyanobacterium RL_1_2]|nr:iron-sulfur cluster assembly accessory protein [Synechococcaceae cyanobacterium RL_1_2]